MTVIGEAFVAISPEAASFASKLQAQFQALNLGSIGAIAGGALAAGAVAGLIKVGRQFGAVKQQIQKETGETGAALAGTFNEVKKVFADVPESLGAVTTAVDELTRRGVPLGKTMDTLAKQVLGLAKVTGTDLQQDVQSATDVFKKFNVPLSQQPALLDEIFKATQKSGKSLDDLLGPLNANGASLAAFGFTAQQSVALIGNLSASGLDASKSLGTLRVAFGRIVKAGDDPKQVFADLNKEFASKNPHAMADAIKVLGSRGFELATAMQRGKFDFDAFLKSVTDGKNGIIATEEATRTLGDKISIMAHGALNAIQPLASTLTRGISQGLTDLTEPIGNLVTGAASLATAFAPLAFVLGGTLVVAFRAILPVISSFGLGLGALGTAIQAIPPPLFVALAGALALASVGFDNIAVAVFDFGAAIDTALGPVGLIVAAVTLLGFGLGHFGSQAKDTATDTSALNDIFTTTADGASTLGAALTAATGTLDDFLQKQLAVKTGGISGDEILSGFGASFAGAEKALLSTTDAYVAWGNALKFGHNPTEKERQAIFAFSGVLDDTRQSLEQNAKATLEGAVASGQLSSAHERAALATTQAGAAARAAGENQNDYLSALRKVQPEIDRNTAAQNAAASAAVNAQPAFAGLVGQFAQGQISSKTLADQLTGMGFTADGAKAKVSGLTKEIQQFGSAIDSSFPDVTAAAQGLNNNLSAVAVDLRAHQLAIAAEYTKLRDTGGAALGQMSGAIAANVAAINADTAKLASNKDLDKFTQNLQTQAVNISTFYANINKLVHEGNATLGRELLDLGVQGGASLAAGFANDKGKADAANATAKTLEHVKETTKAQALAQFPAFEGIGKSLGDATARGLGKADIAAGVRGQQAAVNRAVASVAASASKNAKFDFATPAKASLDTAASAISHDQRVALAAIHAAQEASKGWTLDFTAPAKAGLAQTARAIGSDRTVGRAATQVAKTTSDNFGSNLDLRSKTAKAVGAAASAIGSAAGPPAAAAGLGASTGNAFVAGVVGGISSPSAVARVNAAATQLAGQAQKAANKKLGIASPSKVGMKIGDQFAQGIALGVLGGQTAINANVDTVAGGLASRAQSVVGSVVSLGESAQTIQTLRQFLQQLQTTAVSTVTTVDAATTALQNLLSTAENALPSAASALSTFLSTQANAQSTFDASLVSFRTASKEAAADAKKLGDQHARTAQDFTLLILTKGLLDTAIARKLPTDQIAQLQAAYDHALGTFQKAGEGLKSITQALKDQRAAVHDAAKALGDASTALQSANDPAGFTKTLNDSTARARAFTADLRKLVAEGFRDLAGKLAEQGADAAGKLADAFADNKHQAKLANNAVRNASKYADTFTKQISHLLGGDKATAAAAAGANTGAAVGSALGSSLSSAADNSIATLIDKLQRVRLTTAPVQVNTAAAEKAIAAIPQSLVFTPEIGSLPSQIAAAVSTAGPVSVDLTPHLAALAALPPMNLDLIPVVGPVTVPAGTIDITARLGPIDVPPAVLDVTARVAPVTLPPAVLDVTGHLAPLVVPPLTVPVTVELAPFSIPTKSVPVHVDLDGLTLAPLTVEVTPLLQPLPKLDPITVDVIPKATTAAAQAVAVPVTGLPTGGGAQTITLDLTVVLDDGRVVKVQRTLPVPPPGALTQAVKTEIHAGS